MNIRGILYFNIAALVAPTLPAFAQQGVGFQNELQCLQGLDGAMNDSFSVVRTPQGQQVAAVATARGFILISSQGTQEYRVNAQTPLYRFLIPGTQRRAQDPRGGVCNNPQSYVVLRVMQSQRQNQVYLYSLTDHTEALNRVMNSEIIGTTSGQCEIEGVPRSYQIAVGVAHNAELNKIAENFISENQDSHRMAVQNAIRQRLQALGRQLNDPNQREANMNNIYLNRAYAQSPLQACRYNPIVSAGVDRVTRSPQTQGLLASIERNTRSQTASASLATRASNAPVQNTTTMRPVMNQDAQGAGD